MTRAVYWAALLLTLAGLHAADAQTAPAPPAIWMMQARPTPPIPDADREYPGAHARGDLLAEYSHGYMHTARLATAYSARLDPTRTIQYPAGAPLISLIMISVAVDQPAGAPRIPQAAPGTTHWCALAENGGSTCFFWDSQGGVYANPYQMGGAPSERGQLGNPVAVPALDIVDEDAGLPPIHTQLFLDEMNAEGFIVRTVTQEAGHSYARTSQRYGWDTWTYTWIGPRQKMLATPVRAADGAIASATISFMREH